MIKSLADFSNLQGKTVQFWVYNKKKGATEGLIGDILSVLLLPDGFSLRFILLCQRGEEKFLKSYVWSGEEELTIISPSLAAIPGY